MANMSEMNSKRYEVLTTSSVVVEVSLDIAADHTSQCSHEIIHLTRVRTSHCVRHTHTVYADLVDGAVDGQQVDQLGPERVLR